MMCNKWCVAGLIVAGVSFFSCKKSPCNDVSCFNGYCENGQCICLENYYGQYCQIKCVYGTGSDYGCSCYSGYTGAACDTPINTLLEGVYRLTENCPSDTFSTEYSQWVASQADPSVINVIHFAGWLCDGRPVVVPLRISDNLTTITLPQRLYLCDSALSINALIGTIEANGERIVIQYNYTDYSGPVDKTETCTTIYQRL